MVNRNNVLVFVFTLIPEFILLLLKRTQEKGGFWQPISGGIESEETALQTLTREVLEETGIQEFIRIIDLEHTFSHRTEKDGVLMDMMDICFAVEVREKMKITLSNEHVEYRWCDLKETRELLRWEPALVALKKLVDLVVPIDEIPADD